MPPRVRLSPHGQLRITMRERSELQPLRREQCRTEFQDLCLERNDRPSGRLLGAGLGLRPDPDHPEAWSTASTRTHCGSTRCPNRKRVKPGVHLDVHVLRPSRTWSPGCHVRATASRGPTFRSRGRRAVRVRPRRRHADRLPALRGRGRLRRPAAIATWWAGRFGVPVQHGTNTGDGEFLLAGRFARGRPSSWCSARARAQTVKNRLHWDVRARSTSCRRRGPSAPGPRRRHHLAHPGRSGGNEFLLLRRNDPMDGPGELA